MFGFDKDIASDPSIDPTPIAPGSTRGPEQRRQSVLAYIERHVDHFGPGLLLLTLPIILGAPVWFLWFIIKYPLHQDAFAEWLMRWVILEPLAILALALVVATFVPRERTRRWLVLFLYRTRHLVVGLMLFFVGFVVFVLVGGLLLLYQLNNPPDRGLAKPPQKLGGVLQAPVEDRLTQVQADSLRSPLNLHVKLHLIPQRPHSE